jgi:hypothetical protein
VICTKRAGFTILNIAEEIIGVIVAVVGVGNVFGRASIANELTE